MKREEDIKFEHAIRRAITLKTGHRFSKWIHIIPNNELIMSGGVYAKIADSTLDIREVKLSFILPDANSRYIVMKAAPGNARYRELARYDVYLTYAISKLTIPVKTNILNLSTSAEHWVDAVLSNTYTTQNIVESNDYHNSLEMMVKHHTNFKRKSVHASSGILPPDRLFLRKGNNLSNVIQDIVSVGCMARKFQSNGAKEYRNNLLDKLS